MRDQSHTRVLAAIAAAALMPGAAAIEPKAMLSANQYSDAMPNPSGVSAHLTHIRASFMLHSRTNSDSQEFALFTSRNYSFDTQESSSVWKRLDLDSGDITDWYVGDGISELVFVGSESTSILYLNGTNEEEDGGVSLYFADAESIDNATLVASLPAPYSGLKAAETKSGDIRFLLSAQAFPNGTVYNEQLATPPASTGMIYDSIFVRHWVSNGILTKWDMC